jgi:hypothetical protein
MARGKKPTQFGPRNAEQKQRHNGASFPRIAHAHIPPELALRNRALARLEILPPYQSVMPYEQTFQMTNGVETRQFKGLTKREHIVTAIVAATISKDGLPLRDEECQSITRRALMMSEHVLQTLSRARGIDTEGIMKQLEEEDNATKEKTDEPPAPPPDPTGTN